MVDHNMLRFPSKTLIRISTQPPLLSENYVVGLHNTKTQRRAPNTLFRNFFRLAVRHYPRHPTQQQFPPTHSLLPASPSTLAPPSASRAALHPRAALRPRAVFHPRIPTLTLPHPHNHALHPHNYALHPHIATLRVRILVPTLAPPFVETGRGRATPGV